MKILLTSNDITVIGGVERVVVNLANAFDELGFEVEILSFYASEECCKYALNPTIKLTFYKPFLDIHTKKPFLRFFAKTLYRFFVAFKMKKAYKDVDIAIYNCYFYPYFKNKTTRYFKIKHSHFKNTYSVKDKIFDALIVISSKELEQWKRKFKNVFLIHNFLSTIPKENADIYSKVVLSVGRMSKDDIKGFVRLIDIWNLLQKQEYFKEWRLHIVGEGDFRGYLQKKIKELGLENSILLKPFTQEISKEYLNASIYCLTSKNEGLPTVLLEASSYALACISFDILTGPSDIIEDERSGFLIPDNDLQLYAKSLALLMQDSCLREKFGKRAKEIALKKFSKEQIMQEWLILFQTL
ncbi:glycosyltransferase family 4 protein [Campylobacter sp. MIT 21-1685]|uniref:glycosyltransferase family 4 protein n=1 Tax=unclassified Campylobacter TaxID=2593542 RepID=UPI00224B351D|nr:MULTISPECIES: glycosyltransferase family 4 protein [unclassified Campylobacter]MCX2683749.1 glycosyltransferase family 4 protein [Campylobacter sp. MIT 21-1684]MCX2752021.1 glycosyltransferase family 4 protein [Campylobacter sp. MIT 21-1682]MCX2808226.1 glycosyltransferase family 4 protein [Campylobacter sp. MIT 21-1685]